MVLASEAQPGRRSPIVGRVLCRLSLRVSLGLARSEQCRAIHSNTGGTNTCASAYVPFSIPGAADDDEPNAVAAPRGELSRAGFQTEMIGKLHLWPLRRRFGFDHMQLADNTREANNDYVQWLRGQRGELHGVVDPGMSHGVR